jgi:hypothetical protein
MRTAVQEHKFFMTSNYMVEDKIKKLISILQH